MNKVWPYWTSTRTNSYWLFMKTKLELIKLSGINITLAYITKYNVGNQNAKPLHLKLEYKKRPGIQYEC
jgi:hypothetical protein